MRARKAYDFWCRLMEIVFKLGHVSRDYGVHGTRADRTTVDASCSCLPYLQQTLFLSSHKPQPFRDGSGTSALPVEHPAERGTGQANKRWPIQLSRESRNDTSMFFLQLN